jgi:pimeloyl-ACP methyl ester carboxylesterase
VIDFGGTGQGILLLHGLMGRAATWWPVAQWLSHYGHVIGLDARSHGRSPHRGGPWRTEDFVSDAVAVIESRDLAPAVVIGHSMGALHAWALAASRPELVRAVVAEDMAPDQRGRTADGWHAHFATWPVPFPSVAAIRAFFGTLGDYFAECFEERPDGYHLIASLDELFAIADEWATRDYWPLIDRITCPMLVLEAANTAMPPGQQAEVARRTPGPSTHLVIPDSGHVIHEDAPHTYRGAVEAFLSALG